MLSLNLQSVVGVAEKKSWSQALNLVNERGEAKGLCLRIASEGDDGALELGSVGSSVLSKLQNSSDNWLGEVKEEVGELEANGYKVTAIACEQVGEKIRIWGTKGGKAYLWRGGKVAELVNASNQEQIIGGTLLGADVVMLGVGRGEEWSKEKLIALMGERENAKELIAREIHGGKWEGDVALLIGTTTDQNKKETDKLWKMPRLKIQRMNEEPKRFNLILGGGIVVGLVVLSIIGGVYKVKKDARAEFETRQNEVSSLIAEARATVETNPERSKALISQSREMLGSYIKESHNEQYKLAAEKLLASLEKEEQAILKLNQAKLATTVELTVLDEQLRAKNFESDGSGNIYVWDEPQNELMGINLKDKSKIEVKVDNNKKLDKFAVVNNRYVGVTDEGILEIVKDTQKVVIERDEAWGEIGQIGLFGGNIYILDLGNSEIWKYSALDSGYAERKRWLAKGIVLDLTKVVDWVVDGDVWLLTSSGKLERYSRGAPTKFELSGFPSVGENGRFVDPVAVTVGGDKVYVLERGAKRVVTFDTNGKYLGQQVDEELGKADDLAVYEGKGYVLVNNVVKEFEL